jgi:hypothetical protein
MERGTLQSKSTDTSFETVQTFSLIKSTTYKILPCAVVQEPSVPNWKQLIGLREADATSVKRDVGVDRFSTAIYGSPETNGQETTSTTTQVIRDSGQRVIAYPVQIDNGESNSLESNDALTTTSIFSVPYVESLYKRSSCDRVVKIDSDKFDLEAEQLHFFFSIRSEALNDLYPVRNGMICMQDSQTPNLQHKTLSNGSSSVNVVTVLDSIPKERVAASIILSNKKLILATAMSTDPSTFKIECPIDSSYYKLSLSRRPTNNKQHTIIEIDLTAFDLSNTNSQ